MSSPATGCSLSGTGIKYMRSTAYIQSRSIEGISTQTAEYAVRRISGGLGGNNLFLDRDRRDNGLLDLCIEQDLPQGRNGVGMAVKPLVTRKPVRVRGHFTVSLSGDVRHSAAFQKIMHAQR